MGQRKTFTPDFKREAVQLLESGSRPASQIARELGIKRNQLYKWQSELKTRGAVAFPGAGMRLGPTRFPDSIHRAAYHGGRPGA